MLKPLSVIALLSVAFAILFLQPAQASSTRAQAEWTLLIYLNGRNDLSEDLKRNLSEIEASATAKSFPSAQVNVVVESGFEDEEVVRRTRYSASRKSVLQTLSGTDADLGLASTFRDFIQWGQKRFPAKHYLVLLANHGGGSAGISWDDKTQHHLKLSELGEVLSSVGKIDVFATYACLMGMTETLLEIAGNVDYLAASEDSVTATAFKYPQLLRAFSAAPQISPKDAAIRSAEAIGNFTVSAYDLSRTHELTTALSHFARQITGLPADALAYAKQASAESLRFYDTTFSNVDVIDFLRRYRRAVIERFQLDPAPAQEVESAIGAVLLWKHAEDAPTKVNRNKSYLDSTGVAIWMPESPYNFLDRGRYRDYMNLKIERLAGWGQVAERLSRNLHAPGFVRERAQFAKAEPVASGDGAAIQGTWSCRRYLDYNRKFSNLLEADSEPRSELIELGRLGTVLGAKSKNTIARHLRDSDQLVIEKIVTGSTSLDADAWPLSNPEESLGGNCAPVTFEGSSGPIQASDCRVIEYWNCDRIGH